MLAGTSAVFASVVSGSRSAERSCGMQCTIMISLVAACAAALSRITICMQQRSYSRGQGYWVRVSKLFECPQLGVLNWVPKMTMPASLHAVLCPVLYVHHLSHSNPCCAIHKYACEYAKHGSQSITDVDLTCRSNKSPGSHALHCMLVGSPWSHMPPQELLGLN